MMLFFLPLHEYKDLGEDLRERREKNEGKRLPASSSTGQVQLVRLCSLLLEREGEESEA